MKAIVAIDESGGIGYKNDLPWPKIKEDFQWFKEFTLEKNIVVGNKTFLTLPPLKKRIIYCLSKHQVCSTQTFSRDNRIDRVIHNINDIKYIPEDSIVCGGAQIYKLLIPKCLEVYVTHVEGVYSSDTFFPFSEDEINKMFPLNEFVRGFPGGHRVFRYYKK
jgi:dihydrofolate reductase